MKQLFSLVLLAVLFVSFNSCSKDDDKEPSIIGVWYVVSKTISQDGTPVHTEVMQGCDKDSNFEFFQDNKVVYEKSLICNGYSVMSGNYNPAEKTMTLMYNSDKEGTMFSVTQVNQNEIDITVSYPTGYDDRDAPKIESETLRCHRGEPKDTKE